MHAPEFWYGDRRDWRGAALAPIGGLFAIGGRLRRAVAEPHRAGVPVVCVGNLTVGGVGKTPIALDLGRRLTTAGIASAFVSRGYGGSLEGPIRVDPNRHTAAEVGDEPLLLAGVAPTWVARKRADGVAAAEAGGAASVILDDGFQNPTVAKDLSLIVVDGHRGFGNGRVVPAGPLRESVEAGRTRADAVVVMGDDDTGVAELFGSLPVLRAALKPDADARALAGKRVVAFAGIGDPDKFFRTLAAIGCEVISATGYADHSPFDDVTVRRHLDEAERLAADAVVATAKDAVRLPPELAAAITVVGVRVAWDDSEAVDALLEGLFNDVA